MILTAIIKGIEKAFNKYYKWSGGEWLHYTNEYLINIYIAEELSKLFSKHNKLKYITLENNVKYILKEAGGRLKGRFKQSLKIKEKYDIILWKIIPFGVIEVKKHLNGFYTVKEDVVRIIET